MIATNVLSRNSFDVKDFYRISAIPDISEKLQRVGNCSTDNFSCASTTSRNKALAQLAMVRKVLITTTGSFLMAGNVVEVRCSNLSGHQYMMRVLENSGAMARERLPWVHVRPNSTVNGHYLYFDNCLRDAIASAKMGVDAIGKVRCS